MIHYVLRSLRYLLAILFFGLVLFGVHRHNEFQRDGIFRGSVIRMKEAGVSFERIDFTKRRIGMVDLTSTKMDSDEIARLLVQSSIASIGKLNVPNDDRRIYEIMRPSIDIGEIVSVQGIDKSRDSTADDGP